MGVARRSRGSRCVGMDREATGRIPDLTLSRGITIRLSFAKDHCLLSEGKVKGQGQKQGEQWEGEGASFHPQHLGHRCTWSRLSQSASAGKGGGQTAPDPMHRNSASKSSPSVPTKPLAGYYSLVQQNKKKNKQSLSKMG